MCHSAQVYGAAGEQSGFRTALSAGWVTSRSVQLCRQVSAQSDDRQPIVSGVTAPSAVLGHLEASNPAEDPEGGARA